MSGFKIGKQYRLVDASVGDGQLQRAIDMGLVAFPEDGIFTCHSIGGGNDDHLSSQVAYSHTDGIVNLSWDKGGDTPTAYADDLESGIFEEVVA